MKHYWLWLVSVILVTGGIIAIVAVRQNSSSDTNQLAPDIPTTIYGVSWSPKSSSVTDLNGFFSKVGDVGNVLSWAGSYADLAKPTGNAAKTVLAESKKRGYTPVLIVGPAKGEVFDGIFQQGFRDDVLGFIKENNVPYLGLGNEIDQFYLESPSRYEVLLKYLQSISDEVHSASPGTKTFTILQLERLKGLQGGLFGGANDPGKSLMGQLTTLSGFDFVAFTTYPCLSYKSPSEIPDGYYSQIASYTTLPIVFTEIGWFRETPVAGWESSENEQAEFISRFQRLTSTLKPRIVIWPFLYDQKIQAPFKQIGLLGTEQSYQPWIRSVKRLATN